MVSFVQRSSECRNSRDNAETVVITHTDDERHPAMSVIQRVAFRHALVSARVTPPEDYLRQSYRTSTGDVRSGAQVCPRTRPFRARCPRSARLLLETASDSADRKSPGLAKTMREWVEDGHVDITRDPCLNALTPERPNAQTPKHLNARSVINAYMAKRVDVSVSVYHHDAA